MKASIPAKTIFPWLHANLGKHCTAPLTGSDTRALQAAVQIIEQWAYDQDASLIEAFGLVVGRMQPQCQELAYHAIAHIVNWEDRSRLWVQAGLPEFAPRLCAYEPGGSARTGVAA